MFQFPSEVATPRKKQMKILTRVLFATLVIQSILLSSNPAARADNATSPIKLEALTPQMDNSSTDSKVRLQGGVEDTYNPTVLSIPSSGWKGAYEVGRKLFESGDYPRALNAFQIALEESSDFSESDPRIAMARKAALMAKSRVTLRSRLGYATDNKNPQALTGKVTGVFPPSLAWLAGLKKDDRVLKGEAKGDRFNLTVKRGAKQLTLSLRLGKPRMDNQKLEGGGTKTTLDAGIEKKEQILAKYDCSLLIDCSGSMILPMAPSSGLAHRTTRWNWCRDQSLSFFGTSSKYFSDGISIIPFNHRFAVAEHAKLDEIADVFKRVGPSGGTNIANPLKFAIDKHFKGSRKSAIMVLTDGLADLSDIRSTIIDATRRMRNKDEIVITFLEVDKTTEGYELLEALDNKLTDAGARFDIVNVKEFSELMKSGLKEAIIESLSEANAP